MNATLADNHRILALDLILSRSFVSDAEVGIFARDIACSFLRSATAKGDEARIANLANEIEFPPDLQVKTLGVRREVRLPAEPSEGYRTYLGKQQCFEQLLSRSRLRLENAGVLILSMETER